MLRLIQYELKKVFSASFLKILLLLLLAVNIIFCADFTKARTNPEKRPILEAAYEEYLADPQSFIREYEDLMRYYRESASPTNPFPEDPYRFGGRAYEITDWEVYEEVLAAADAGIHFKEETAALVDQAKGVRSGLPEKDSYHYSYQGELIKIYSSLMDRVECKGGIVFAWDILFSYESDYFPVFLIVILCTAYVCLCDKQNGFYAVAGVCRKGRRPSVFAKLASSILLSCSMILLFSISTAITVGLISGGYSDPSEAIQALQAGWGYSNMIRFPFALNMWQGYLFSVFLKFCAAALLSALVFLVSMLFQRIWLSFFFGCGLAAFCYAIPQWKSAADFTQWRYLGLRSLFSPGGTMPRYRALDLFGSVMDLNGVLYLILGIVIVFTLLISFRLYSRPRRTAPKKIFGDAFSHFWKRSSAKKQSFSLILYEFFKNRIFYLILVFALLLKIWVSSVSFQPDLSSYDRVYKQYINKSIGGVFTEEKRKRIESETEWYREITGCYEEMNEKHFKNEVSTEEFIRYLRDYSAAEVKLKVLDNLHGQATYLKGLYEEKGFVGSFVYETGFDRFVHQGVDWVFVVFICFFSVRQYLIEFKRNASGSSMYTLIQTTNRGRVSLFLRKASACAVTVFPLWLIFKGIDLCLLLHHFELPDLSAPLVSMSAYSDMFPSVSILDYMIGITFFGLLGSLLLSGIAFLIAYFVKKRFLVYALTALAIFVPHFAAETNVEIAAFTDLTMLYDTDRLFRQYNFYGFLLFFAIVASAVIGGLILAKKKVKEGTV